MSAYPTPSSDLAIVQVHLSHLSEQDEAGLRRLAPNGLPGLGISAFDGALAITLLNPRSSRSDSLRQKLAHAGLSFDLLDILHLAERLHVQAIFLAEDLPRSRDLAVRRG